MRFGIGRRSDGRYARHLRSPFVPDAAQNRTRRPADVSSRPLRLPRRPDRDRPREADRAAHADPAGVRSSSRRLRQAIFACQRPEQRSWKTSRYRTDRRTSVQAIVAVVGPLPILTFVPNARVRGQAKVASASHQARAGAGAGTEAVSARADRVCGRGRRRDPPHARDHAHSGKHPPKIAIEMFDTLRGWWAG